ncbi:F-box/WD repeat-containing protein 7 [Chanos chanos]|uniref:F-box/WD repeat-containing protein 7 n=1 Tax=Chanos chanos TaxID=29144 RepID=A0A6J2W7P2_CHACN|nr:F-box/WD repeat-containing protein 7-like [Chanos chanos]
MGEVRKLQKKLRQIENLEIRVSLTPEERVKVSKKAELRSRLAELLLQLSGPQQSQCTVGNGEEPMKRHVEGGVAAGAAQSPAPKLTRACPDGEERRERPDPPRPEPDNTPPTAPPDPQTGQQETDLQSLKASWEAAKFRLRRLEGHSDIITCVVAVDNLVISGSRDTTVKVWHVPTATEQKNLGGHSGGVTCLCAPPPEHCRRLAHAVGVNERERLVISGSSDCTVRVWALTSGHCVKSVYTFNAVNALCFSPEGDGYIITGSDAGKLQVWNWLSLDNCQSINAHQDAITTLQSQGPLLFCGSVEGGLSVWEVGHSRTEPLRRLNQWGAEVTGCGCGHGRLDLSPRGDRVFLACGRASIRILHWSTGTLTRLTNHSSVAGVTDCVNQTSGLLIGSCFDLSNGESTLNLFALPQCKYLVSITAPESSRVLCFTAWLTASGGHRWVTGGRDLIVWEQLQGKTKQKGDVIVRRDRRLDDALMESDDDDEEEEEEEEESDVEVEDEDEDNISQNAETEESMRSSWLRCILQ